MGRPQPEVFLFICFSAIQPISGRGPGRIFVRHGPNGPEQPWIRPVSRLPQGRSMLKGGGI